MDDCIVPNLGGNLAKVQGSSLNNRTAVYNSDTADCRYYCTVSRTRIIADSDLITRIILVHD